MTGRVADLDQRTDAGIFTLDLSACTNACILDAPGSLLDSCVLQ